MDGTTGWNDIHSYYKMRIHSVTAQNEKDDPNEVALYIQAPLRNRDTNE